jgi:predicted DNA-binding transcriptional regulator YafY
VSLLPEAKKTITKTERILSIYHLFRFCEEVSMQELRNYFRNISDKTFSRDIALLKRAGVPIRFSGRRKAFVLVDETGKESTITPHRAPDFPEGKKERQFIEKIIRLMTIMDELPYEDCDVWYRETFPEASKRTMHRDFATLKRVGPGYVIYYKREWENPYDKDDEQPPGHYYFEGVHNA